MTTTITPPEACPANNSAPVEKRSKCWEHFDAWADKLVKKEIRFEVFAREVAVDVGRLARQAQRRKFIPGWMSDDDVRSQVLTLIWFYAMKRVAPKSGVVGFDATKYRNAGAWLRWKVAHKLDKAISVARGESQHTRRGPGRPEYLSKTGELPDLQETDNAEAAVARSRDMRKLEKLCRDAREFSILSAISRSLGDDRTAVAYLVEAKVFEDPGTAYAGMNAFVEEFSKKHGAAFAPKKKRAA